MDWPRGWFCAGYAAKPGHEDYERKAGCRPWRGLSGGMLLLFFCFFEKNLDAKKLISGRNESFACGVWGLFRGLVLCFGDGDAFAVAEGYDECACEAFGYGGFLEVG